MAKTPKTSKTPPKTQAETQDPTLAKVMKAYRASRKYTQGGFWDTWNSCWKLYNNKRVQIGYDGFTEVFIPETYTEIQGIKAHLVNGPDGSNIEVNFLPTHPDQKGDTNLAQDLFNYAWNKDNMPQKVDAAITEYLVTGNAYIWSAVGDDGLPCQRVVSAKDCWFDVHATNYDNLEYGGYRYLTTLDELKEATVVNGMWNEDEEQTDENSPTKPRYTNLDQIGEYSEESDDKFAKEEREEMLAGSLLEDKDGIVECIIAFIDDRMITIANRRTVIEDVPTPFQREKKTIQSVDDQGNPMSFELPEIEPFIPVAPFRNLVDPNLWYARGDVEMIAESQERLNDVQAQKSDNLTFQLNRMWALDPNFAQKIDEIQSVPGAVFTIPPGALEQIQTAPMGQDADVEIARIKSEMQAATAANEMMASTLQTAGRKSAYMINQELVMLGARFKVKVSQLENEAFKILVANMWKIMQIYIDKEISVRVEGPGGPSFAQYNPGLFLGDWDFDIKLGVTADAKKQTEMQQAMQFYLLASKLPFVNQEGLFAMTATTMFDKTARDVENLIMPPNPEAKPTIVPKLIETIQFGQDLYPDEQAEVLSEAGVNPSPMRQEQAGVPAPPANPEAAALHAKIIHGKGKAGNPTEDASQNQVATAPAEGSPPNVANIPRVPNA